MKNGKKGLKKSRNFPHNKLMILSILLIASISLVFAFDFPSDTLTVNTFTGNLTNLSEMQDVNIPSPANTEVLTYNSGTGFWESAVGTAVDLSWLANYTNLVADNCSPNVAIGIFVNGTFQCSTSSSTDTTWLANYSISDNLTLWTTTTNSSYLINTGDIGVGNYSFNNGNFSINNTGFFYDSNSGNIGIGTATPGDHTLHIVGHQGITRTADSTDQHALEIIIDASGFGDIKAIFIDYITGAISDGQDEEVILINIDDFLATGGDVVGLEVVTTQGGSKIIGLEVGVLVNPIKQLSGIFGNMDSATVKSVDRRSEFISTGSDITLFVSNLDNITIGNSVKFEEIEFILDTVASGAGVKPEFWYSTGVGDWTQFTPSDGTNGFRNTGVVLWLDSDIPLWATGLGSEFLILINRTQGGLATSPVEDLVQIASAIEYTWNEKGNLTVANVTGDYFFGNGSQLTDITSIDTSWLLNYTNQVANNCGTDFVTGIFVNGTFRCATSSSTDTTWLANFSISNNLTLWTITFNSTTNDSINNYIDSQDLIFNTSITNFINDNNVSVNNYVDSQNIIFNDSVVNFANDIFVPYTGGTKNLDLGDNNFTVNSIFHIDSDNQRVGIGTNVPASALDVVGNAEFLNNFTVGGSALFVNSNQFLVGIGTDTPEERLHVIGSAIRIESNDDDLTTKFATVSTGSYDNSEEAIGLFFGAQIAGAINLVSFGGGNGVLNSVNQVSFYTSPAINTIQGTERMIIKNDGKMGIGISSPAVLLHINSSGNVSVLRLEDDDAFCDYNPETTGVIVACTSDKFALNKTNISSPTQLEKDRITDWILNAPIESYDINGKRYTGYIAQDIQVNFPEKIRILPYKVQNGTIGDENFSIPTYEERTMLGVVQPTTLELQLTIQEMSIDMTLMKSSLCKLGEVQWC